MLVLLLLAGCPDESLEARCDRCGPGCAPEDAAACHELADSVRRAPSIDAPRAALLFGRACDAGHGEACAGLGLLVQDGIGVPDDDARALEIYGRGCDLGAGVG